MENSEANGSTFELLFIRLDIDYHLFHMKTVVLPSTERCQIELTQPVAEPHKSTVRQVLMLQNQWR